MSLRAINVRVGDLIEYIGPTVGRWTCRCPARACERADHKQVQKAGNLGVVTRVDPIDPPNHLLVTDEDTQETYAGRDGHALVAWTNYEPGLIWPADEGSRWRRATSRKLALSPTQTALLLRLSTAKGGFETRPEGYTRAAGPLASRWQRTVTSLAARALVTVTSHGAQITDAGRAVVIGLRGAS